MSDEELQKLALETDYETVKAIAKGLLGDYEQLKPLNDLVEAAILTFAFIEYANDSYGEIEDHFDLDDMMKEHQNEIVITGLYLYCNWRVWATHEHNEELAKKYQKLCDEIDDYIFDNWSKDKIRFFVSETD